MATQIISLRDGATLHIHTLGRAVQVTAVATSADDANAYCAIHQTQSVIAELPNGVILIAVTKDKGTKL